MSVDYKASCPPSDKLQTSTSKTQQAAFTEINILATKADFVLHNSPTLPQLDQTCSDYQAETTATSVQHNGTARLPSHR